MSAQRTLVGAFALASVLIMSCGAPHRPNAQTGIEITVRYDAAAGLDQLVFSGERLDDEGAAFAPGALPNPPRPLVLGVDTVLILVDDALATSAVRLRVEGQSGGLLHAEQESDIELQPDEIVSVDLTLIHMQDPLPPVDPPVDPPAEPPTTPTPTPTPTPSPGVECSNGLDDDGDGLLDGEDPGCDSPDDPNEKCAGGYCPPCDNGLDDDGDGKTDYSQEASVRDVECASAWDDEGPYDGACGNGLDDDGDGAIDVADAGCQNFYDVSER